jgi:DNA-binding HxlR family transcriptional regulator
VDWQRLATWLAPVRRRWDLAVLVNLTTSDNGMRPAELIKTINMQSRDGQISWKVLEDRLRSLEASGYIAREQLPNVPRTTRYWALPPARRLITALTAVEIFYEAREPDGDCGGHEE